MRCFLVAPLVLSLALASCSSSESNSDVATGNQLPTFDESSISGDEGSSAEPGVEQATPNSNADGDGAGSNEPAIENGEGNSSSEGTGAIELTGSEPEAGSGSGSDEASGSEDPTAGSEEMGSETPAEETPEEVTPDEPPAESTLGPSPGCSGGSGAAGNNFSIPLPTGNAAYAVALPPGYDGQTPMPLIFGFHGRNRTHLDFRNVDASQIQTEIEPRAVMVYPKSQGGNGWNFDNEVPPNVAFFEALYDRVLADYCVDTSHVFAIGHSSGGYFSNILACRYPDRLRGIGAVAGQTQECSGHVAAIVIHGETDAVVSFAGGVASRDGYLRVNGCTNQSQPAAVAPCIAYQGCEEGFPVQWCQHTEPEYFDNGQPTNHGWPRFASRAIGQFLFSLP